MSEDARREMELKWKAAQEAWKVRAACRADPSETPSPSCEDARREMELKWKAAQEAWKVRAARRGATMCMCKP